MTGRPDWLPAMCSVDGEWNKVCPYLYQIFESDFKGRKPTLLTMLVWWHRRVLKDDPYGYEEGFWHLITRHDENGGERLFDPRRAERLPWCGPTISNAADHAVKVWDFEEGRGQLRTYVWLEKWDYAIVFEKRSMRVGIVAFLVTAFHVDGEYRRRLLLRKFEKRRP